MPDTEILTLPLLPLTNGVVLPQMVVTLAVESPEARDAAVGALASDRRVLLVPRVGLVVILDHDGAGARGAERVDAERADVERVADRRPRRLTFGQRGQVREGPACASSRMRPRVVRAARRTRYARQRARGR